MTWRVFAAVAAMAIVVMCARFAVQARDQPLTSDESLYLSEAVSIAHGRLTYASGDPIVHRPPLYPATLAPVMAATGNDVTVARAVPLAYALGALAALFWLALITFDARVAFAAVAFTAVASGTSRLSGSFFVDTPMAMWLMLSLAALLAAQRAPGRRRVAVSAASGALLGLAFLTKESAVAWLPLPVLLSLLSSPGRRIAAPAAAAWYAAFAALALPWFAWVAWHTDVAFKLDALSPVAIAGAACVGIAGGAALLAARGWNAHRRLALAAAITAVWAALLLAALESRPEPAAVRYWATVPGWTRHVFATSVEPWALVAAASVAALWFAARRDDGGEDRLRPLVLAALLGAPLYLYAANRDWELRQVIWLAYLSYAVLAWATLSVVDALARRWPDTQRRAFAAALVCGLAAVTGFASDPRLQASGPGGGIDWSGQGERIAARWIAELPPGATVVSSRLFSSQLYVDVDGAHDIVQLPTLGVRITPDGVAPFGTLFRYDDASADITAPREWMYVRAYPDRPYAIGLSESDLLATIESYGADYLLLSGDDAAFSSLSYRAYFDANPAFTLVEAYEAEQASFLYHIDRSALVPRRPPLAISGEDFAAFSGQWGDQATSAAFWRALSPSGVALDGDQMLTVADAASLADQLNGRDADSVSGLGALSAR